MTKKAFDTIAKSLNEAQVRFILVGGLAVIAHGYGRSTLDIDLVIRLDPDTITRAFEALARADYRPQVPITAAQFGNADLRETLCREKKMVVLKFWSDSHPQCPLDVFVTEPFDFDAEYSRASVQESAPGIPVRILHLEALIEMKRAAGRPQDLADIAELQLIRDGKYEGL